MNNPTPEQLKTYFEKIGCEIKETEVSYIAYRDNRYTPPFLKDDDEISGQYLARILTTFGISIEEFKQDWNEGT